jgi:hypothetical protein
MKKVKQINYWIIKERNIKDPHRFAVVHPDGTMMIGGELTIEQAEEFCNTDLRFTKGFNQRVTEEIVNKMVREGNIRTVKG